MPDDDGKWIVIAHVRPATGQTIYQIDYVGTAAETELPLLDKAYKTGEICEGEIVVESVPEPVRMMATPVRWNDKVLGVLSREWASRSSRQPGELERSYIGLFQRFASMIAEGSFPFSGPVADSSAAPRVGDGVMVLDEEARVRYASPNATSALHRVGIGANAVGMRLAELGFNDSPVRRAFETQAAGHRGVRADRRRHPARPLHAGARRAARSPAACCCCATSPRCASATGCCCRRTPPSARSITG